jgi:hypothetical protein
MLIRKNLLENIVIITAIVLSYSFIPDYGATLLKVMVFITLCLALVLLFKEKASLRGFDFSIKTTGLLMVFLIVIMLYHQRWGDMNFILKLSVAYVMAITIKLEATLDWMCKLSEKLLIPTVIGFFLGSLGYVFSVTGILTDGRELYLTPMLTSQKTIFFTRATSYFWEPGVFAFVVNIIIAYRLFRKNQSLTAIKVEVFYLLIAQSIGGIFAFSILLIAFFIKEAKNKKIESILSGGIIIFATLFFSNLEGNIQYLTEVLNFFTVVIFDRNLLVDMSYGARIVDFYAPFYAAFESPLWGLKNLDEYLSYSEQIRGFSVEQITNTWSSLAYNFGYPFMVLYLCLVFIATKQYFNSSLVPFVFILLLASSPVYVNIMTLYLIIAMYEQYKNKSHH